VALLDCLRIASMYDHEEEIERGDVACVSGGLVSNTVNALDRVGLGEPRDTHRSRPSGSSDGVGGMDKKLFKRLTQSMEQHAKIARGERPPSRVTSRGSSDDMSPETPSVRRTWTMRRRFWTARVRRGSDERVRDS
jgi:hypothetical protein